MYAPVRSVVTVSEPPSLRTNETAGAVPETVPSRPTRLRAPRSMSYGRRPGPTGTTIRSVPWFWYRIARVDDTFSSTTSAYDPGTRPKPKPPFESVTVELPTAPFPRATATTVTG